MNLLSCELRVITVESERKGHSDKFCDQIADRALDAHLQCDPTARDAIGAFATAGKVLIAGEVMASTQVDNGRIVRDVVRDIGYTPADLGLTRHDELAVEVRVHAQSPEIATAVGGGEHLGAGDQCVMVGNSTDETPEFLPPPGGACTHANQRMDELQKRVSWLGVDGNTLVSVAYKDGRPKSVSVVVLSAQHYRQIDNQRLRCDLIGAFVKRSTSERLMTEDTRILVNSSGRFILGGPVTDTGLTGRKLAVDQYGPVARIGGALSEKAPTKVDRSGAYMARYIAKNIVAAGLAKWCEIQIAYAIGPEEPVGVLAETFGTSPVSNGTLSAAIGELFDLRPAAIIRQLNLNRPIYAPLAVYGHFGRPELKLPWECTDKARALKDLLPRFGEEG